jgi:7,8-dihydropterin-6-yl-methyl-4-(beta-D-ribofuranosyl)aminobenzene 5'-phosphate synthase
MKVTTLIENRPGKTASHLLSEWGLSLHITFDGHSILFDTGSSGLFTKNAEHLSVNVASVDTAVLSHHHFDHGGGLRRFLEANADAKVHLGEVPSGDCFIKFLPFMKKYIGLEKALMTDYVDRFETVSKPTQILPDVFFFPHVSGTRPKPTGNKRLLVRRDGRLTPDDFAHEVVMAIKENNKLVIFTGCSHNGVLNMVDTVAREFEGIPIKAVIGGFHLIASPPFNFMAGSKREVEDLARLILDYPIDRTYTGHCTGTKAFAVLKAVMGERITDLRTGSCFVV